MAYSPDVYDLLETEIKREIEEDGLEKDEEDNFHFVVKNYRLEPIYDVSGTIIDEVEYEDLILVEVQIKRRRIHSEEIE